MKLDPLAKDAIQKLSTTAEVQYAEHEALAPREASPELAEAERLMRQGTHFYGSNLIIADELDRLRGTVARLESEAQSAHSAGVALDACLRYLEELAYLPPKGGQTVGDSPKVSISESHRIKRFVHDMRDAGTVDRMVESSQAEAEQRGRRQALQGFLDVWGRMTSGIWTWKAAAEAVIRWAEEERDVCDGKAVRRG